MHFSTYYLVLLQFLEFRPFNGEFYHIVKLGGFRDIWIYPFMNDYFSTKREVANFWENSLLFPKGHALFLAILIQEFPWFSYGEIKESYE